MRGRDFVSQFLFLNILFIDSDNCGKHILLFFFRYSLVSCVVFYFWCNFSILFAFLKFGGTHLLFSFVVLLVLLLTMCLL